MTALLLILVSRRVPVLALMTLVLSLAAFGSAHLTIPIHFSQSNPAHAMPVGELIAVVTAIFAAGILDPRFWQWERIGTVRTRLVAGAVTASGMAVPLLPALATSLRLPEHVHRSGLYSNVLTASAAVFILSALLGPAIAGGVALLGYFAEAFADNLISGAHDYLPLARLPGDQAFWTTAALTAAIALLLAVTTKGSTVLARRLTQNG